MIVNSSRRTIVISGLKSNLLYPASGNSLDLNTMNADVTSTETQKKGRKRSLEHLSFEEKLLRKKLKNREAAQSSRDRKKARMDELEHTVKLLSKRLREITSQQEKWQYEKTELHEKLDRIMNENDRLKGEVDRLSEENDRLREEVRCPRNGCPLESKTGSAEGSLEASFNVVETSPNPTSSSSDDYLHWFAENCEYDLTNLDELVKDLFAQSSSTKDYDKFIDEMVGSSSTLLEPGRSESEPPTSCLNSLTLPEIEPLDCDSLMGTTQLLVGEEKPLVSYKCDASPFVEINKEAQVTPTLKIEENTVGDEMFVEMISEEVVITSEDLSLYDACDIRPDLNSVCSDSDIDERNTDQGYESIDSPTSDIDHSFSELFPDLAYQCLDSEVC